MSSGPTTSEALIATGFLRNFPDEINARDLNLKKQEVANDLTDTVGTVLLGSTVGCAQCHNHKFDKVSQKEYYQLQAYFVNTSWRDDVPAATAQEIADYEKKKAKYEAATKDIQAKMDAILQPVIDKLEDDRVFGFVPETRVSITKPEAERTAYDRWIYHRNLWTMQGRTRNAVVRLKQKAPDKYVEYTGSRSRSQEVRQAEAEGARPDLDDHRARPRRFAADLRAVQGHLRPQARRSAAGSSRVVLRFAAADQAHRDFVGPAHGARELDREPGKPTDRARVREPRVGPVLRARHHRNRGRLRQDERQADEPGTARLSRRFVRARRQLEHQGAAAADPAVGYLPAVLGVPRGRREGWIRRTRC